MKINTDDLREIGSYKNEAGCWNTMFKDGYGNFYYRGYGMPIVQMRKSLVEFYAEQETRRACKATNRSWTAV